MKAKLTGLTESTITFTEVEMMGGNKLIMHGDEEAQVVLDTAAKLNEVAVLEGCKVLKCIELEKEEQPITETAPVTETLVAPETTPEPAVNAVVSAEAAQALATAEAAVEKALALEAEAAKAGEAAVEAAKEAARLAVEAKAKAGEVTKPQKTETPEEEIEDAPRRGRGRPKGSKNKSQQKVIKRADASPKPEEKSDPSDRVIVMSDSGKPVEGKTITADSIKPEESEATRASIEAMEKLEKEEKESNAQEPVDESALDVNSQMGRTAVVYTGEDAAKVEMKNSFIPESEVAKNADPFIDGEETGAKDKAIEETNAFLDDITEEDAKDDEFIEM